MSDGEAVIREIWRRWNEGEHAFNPDFVDPDVEIHSALTGRSFAGAAEADRWTAEIDDQFEEWELSIAEVEEVSQDRFVVRGSVRARGRQSGIDLDQPITWHVELRDGRLLRLQNVMG